ncbi:MAG: bifunctional methionine sulfoxide reductase B/A protein [Phycisphaerae bacterium]|nr:bifunctional methionine sulfoxide reductase B/A protein [Phycisphaerae bacterium]
MINIKKNKSLWLFFGTLLIISFIITCQAQSIKPKLLSEKDRYILDDFNNTEKSKTEWKFFADSVMGGESTGKVTFLDIDNRSCMALTGKISLANNGGFIQSRKLAMDEKYLLDATDFDGILIRVKGNGKSYGIHLRTNATWLPWQFYQAKFDTDESWQTIKLPFKDFKPESLTKKLDKSKIKSVAVVAIYEEMTAELYVDEIELYKENKMYNELNEKEKYVIINKGTEAPFSGEFHDHFDKGTYTCRQCDKPLFYSSSKFKSDCGWPSFDDQIGDSVKQQPDADGQRIEIICNNCGGHLGHIFNGEGYTDKNARYCVNSISMDFIADKDLERGIFASGCFWGTQYHLDQAKGVIKSSVGYTGGDVVNPTYKQVCTGQTGHYEAIEVYFDPAKTSYEKLTKLYFETHDPTQADGQGPDIGSQYRSAIFYTSDEQKKTAQKLIDILKGKGFDVKTELIAADKFWSAEDYHQDYYQNNGQSPYCHIYTPKF